MQKENISNVFPNHLCSGCGTCTAVCAHGAVTMTRDSMGQLMPVVDAEKCINCGLCYNVCPGIDATDNLYDVNAQSAEEAIVGKYCGVFTGKSTDEVLFKHSQSGGAVAAVLTYLFDSGKIDAALVVKQKDSMPVYEVITSLEQVFSTQRSQYVSVDLVAGLKETSHYNSLAVVGLPCHIEGIVKMQKQSSRFAANVMYKLGLICGGSFPAAMLDIILNNKSCKSLNISELVWRSKVSGNYRSAEIGVFLEGEECPVFLSRNIRHFGKHILTPPRCRLCYDKLNSYSDIVFGDPWGMTDIDKKNGNSLLVTRTELGLELISEVVDAGYLAVKQASMEEVVKGQGIKNKLSYTITSLALYEKNGWTLPGWAHNFENLKAFRKHSDLESEVKNYVKMTGMSGDDIRKTAWKKIRWQLFKNKFSLSIKKIIKH